jgi:hypothetical protein
MCGSKGGDGDSVKSTINRAEELDQSRSYNEENEYAFFNFHFGTAATMGLLFLGFVVVVIAAYYMFREKACGCCSRKSRPVVPSCSRCDQGSVGWMRQPMEVAASVMPRSSSESGVFSGSGNVIFRDPVQGGQVFGMTPLHHEISFNPKRGARELAPSYTGTQ